MLARMEPSFAKRTEFASGIIDKPLHGLRSADNFINIRTQWSRCTRARRHWVLHFRKFLRDTFSGGIDEQSRDSIGTPEGEC
jgi:hypothetical protein